MKGKLKTKNYLTQKNNNDHDKWWPKKTTWGQSGMTRQLMSDIKRNLLKLITRQQPHQVITKTTKVNKFCIQKKLFNYIRFGCCCCRCLIYVCQTTTTRFKPKAKPQRCTKSLKWNFVKKDNNNNSNDKLKFKIHQWRDEQQQQQEKNTKTIYCVSLCFVNWRRNSNNSNKKNTNINIGQKINQENPPKA